MARAGTVLSHWSQLIEGLAASPQDFYTAVGEAIERRQVPDTRRTRTEWGEAGAFSAKREYLRVVRTRHGIDVCGAPFGTGFFVSWWLAELRPSPLIPTIFAILVVALGAPLLLALGGRLLLVAGLLTAFLGLGVLMAQGEKEWHAHLLALPLLGFLWERFFLPPTYYRIDTAMMFRGAIHAAVLEVVDTLTEAKGLPRLTEAERKPILEDFYRRR